MESSDKSAPSQGLRKQGSSWRSSLYDEPLWVSVAWIVVPLAFAGAAVFLAMR